MRCEEAQDLLSDYLDGALLPDEVAPLEAHLGGCEDCRRELDELRWVSELLHSVPQEALPEDLPLRIHAALAALPDEQDPGAGGTATAVASLKPAVEPSKPARPVEPLETRPAARDGLPLPLWKRWSWRSAVAGAAVAAMVIGVWGLQPSSLPRIETAAVQVQTDVALNIGFDVDKSVEGVTYEIELPEGLRFIDDQRQPMIAQSVTWEGSLKQGKTVVPIVVRGVQPGRWAIQATVRKGDMLRKTTIVVPVMAG